MLLYISYIETFGIGKPAHWLSYSIRINSNRLSHFKIRYKLKDLFVALDNFKVKYLSFLLLI